ncbi:endonuclease/exonuclease/phosphatase family protein [Streptomyces cyaneofuscatus]|uniref:endonuclease/exonuclease/phosphatase family protein n=1 Tax=Streptomyces cyaneofuscatus TaxID=66883 RepID=UPI00368691C6
MKNRSKRILTGSALAAAALALFALPAGATTSPAALTPAATHKTGTQAPFTLLQMNLCLSGYAGCYGKTQYPKILDETVDRIKANQADAVTLNEACSKDVDQIAKSTGYHSRFATVIYDGAPLACKSSTGRGVYGNAVLTKDEIRSSKDAPFSTFNGVEERRWLCVTTGRGMDVCTSHLSTGGEAVNSTNSLQCAELAKVLADRGRPTVFAGDVNRSASCAPKNFWTATDAAARQAPGIQHSYGNLAEPTVELENTTYTDHDALVIRTRSGAGGGGVQEEKPVGEVPKTDEGAPAPTPSAPSADATTKGGEKSSVEHNGHGDDDANTGAKATAASAGESKDEGKGGGNVPEVNAAGTDKVLAETGGSNSSTYLAIGGAAVLAAGAAVLVVSQRRRAAAAADRHSR